MIMSLNPGKLYEKLLSHFGKQYWWPVDRRYHEENSCDERLEIMIGAILTQNTAWKNVEKALNNLKKHNCLDTQSILSINDSDLKRYIQPSGFFNQKAERLKTLTIFLENNYQSDLDLFFSQDLHNLREDLLALDGIGPETADSILLYAGNKPIFVVDAYTKRICKRIPLKNKNDSYEEIQSYFQKELKYISKEKTVDVYKEMHALIVELAKNYCKTKPDCNNCIINKECSFNSL